MEPKWLHIDQQRSLLIGIGIDTANLIFIDPYRFTKIIDPTGHVYLYVIFAGESSDKMFHMRAVHLESSCFSEK